MSLVRSALVLGLAALGLAAHAQTAKQQRTHYIVQLADAPVATYNGNLRGLSATRPAAGAKLASGSAAVRAYVSHLDAQRNAVLSSLASVTGTAVPVVYRYNVAFNGFSAHLTAAEVQQLRANPAVLAITEDTPRAMDTTRTPGFLGLSTPGGLWSKLDTSGKAIRGEDIIVGIVDSGVWPEDASFSDKVDANGRPVSSHLPGTVVFGGPPARWAGGCSTGPGFNASHCNNKLIGARFFKAGFDAAGLTVTSLEYASPRDGDGHGSHTASTAAGNADVLALVNGASVGTMSGMAPRARLATYKVCWNYVGGTQATCMSSDSVAAIDMAVADGVDSINFSISGAQTNFMDAVEIAFLNAAGAGVFVAASAGNAGPGNTVAHMSPWLTTVGASTHDRRPVADVTLGNGSVFNGLSVSTGVPNTPLILSTVAALNAPFDDTNTNARLCFLGALDPVKVAGKIVVCDRGTNARVEKSQEVANRGGVGMILLNTLATESLNDDGHFVPTVHLASTARAPVRAYAATAGASASLSSYTQQAGVIAPVMAGFSSRGPNLANPNVLKPDITAPGVAIFAAYTAGLSQAQHDAVANGTLVPPSNANTLQGTSMSSPHIAGIAALFKQLHPTWSPAAIKSALMTANGTVFTASGAVDSARFNYGAGHVAPNPASAVNLVYDAGYGDYAAFLCGVGAIAPRTSTCQTYGAVLPWNLNLPSLTADVVGTVKLRRTVTNRGAAAATYNATATLPGFAVSVTPSVLTLTPGQSGSFDVNVSRSGATLGSWVFGDLTWNDGSTSVKSPLTARALLFSAPPEASDPRNIGSKLLTVYTGYVGSVVAVPRGLVPAQRDSGSVALNASTCFNINVPAGAVHARFALYNSETSGGALSDLDLEVRLGTTLVGSSGSGTSDEQVDLRAPVAGVYQACVVGYAPAGGTATFTLSSWVVTQAPGVGNLRTAATAAATVGGTASAGISWNAAAGVRYMGAVEFTDGITPVGTTLVSVGGAAPPAAAMGAGRKNMALGKRETNPR